MSSAGPGPGASAESSNARWRLACDACRAGGAIGPRPDGRRDAWCEACQRAQVVAAGIDAACCENCGGELTLDAPGFLEAFGAVQDLAAVVAAWRGDPAPLRALLPERPRFLTDLTPPEPEPGDPARVRELLAELMAGHSPLAGLIAWSAEHPDAARVREALAIARERSGDSPQAERDWSAALAAKETARGRLARGVLRARRGDFDRAREDFERAGDTREARWNRAALAIVEAVAITPGLPDPQVIAAARAEAGAASDYWSDPTVGRLLWSLLVERAESRRRAGAPECPDERVLRAAAEEFEHDTFWDRTMVLAGYATLGMRREAAAVAGPLAVELADALVARSFLRARGAEAMRAAVETTRDAVRRDDVDSAAAALETLVAREDLRGYAVPCAACGRGLLRAEALEEAEGAHRA